MRPFSASARRPNIGISPGFVVCFSLLVAQGLVSAQELQTDTDRDGLSDGLEQSLLLQFMPTFMLGKHDCSILPAEFKAGSVVPEVEAENNTIYGQAFPAKFAKDGSPAVELHYYHLWRKDCGRHGHPLDTEHIAVLVQPSSPHLDSARWKAIYWYAAAHENTVCDVSQIARASTLRAEDHGATVWISPGKHASYLNSALCQKGCGADQCGTTTKVAPARVVNLGEPGFPMNGSVFIASTAWPLEHKMSTSNFPASAIARLNQLPDTAIAWFNPGRHTAQGIIATSSTTEQALATGGTKTTAAVGIAGSSTGDALSNASDGTGSALQKSCKHIGHALGASLRHLGEALHITRERHEEQPQEPH